MSQTVVEQIKDRLPLTDVLSSYITLIPAGRQYKAKCPFHNERTASFSVSPDRGLYYCFGCGAKGDLFTFVQQFEGVDFNGALKILAERAGVELKHRDRREDDYGPVYEFLEKTAQRYQNELQKNTEAMLYLKGRGLTEETISQFRLGYAPGEWRFIANSCHDEAEKKIAVRAGLIKLPEKNEGGQNSHYDRFRGRIMFPLSDSSGRIVGFSGRMFPDTPEGPKYLNSPETEVFQKSRVLYGFDKAKFPIKRHNFAILVEGQMDLLLSHQAGFRNTVATSGTAVSEDAAADDHANFIVLSRLTPHLFLAFDGDPAGQKALSRAALVALSLGMNPKVVPVPEGVDPADFLVSEGAEKWKERLKASEHFIVHQTRSVKSAGHSPHMLVRALREGVFPYLSRVGSPIEQNLYLEAIGKEIGIDAGEVGRELARFVAQQPQGKQETLQTPATDTPEGMDARERFAAFAQRFADNTVKILSEKIAALSFEEETVGTLTIPQDRLPASLAVIERDFGSLTDAERAIAAEELAEKVVQQFYTGVQDRLSRQLRDAEAQNDEEKVNALLGRLAALNRRRHEGYEKAKPEL